MILYKVLGEPFWSHDNGYYQLAVQVGSDSGEDIFPYSMLFDEEDEAWAIYNKSINTFEFLRGEDIESVLNEMRGYS